MKIGIQYLGTFFLLDNWFSIFYLYPLSITFLFTFFYRFVLWYFYEYSQSFAILCYNKSFLYSGWSCFEARFDIVLILALFCLII